MSIARIGISGWTYPPWRGGPFYPQGWPQKRELEYASRQVGSIEINGTFYSLQTPKSFRKWYDATPEEFVFSIKGGRFITHLKRLKNVRGPLANFFASGILELEEKLGPILWQLPPNFLYDRSRLESFFRLLPRDTRAAAKLARSHDHPFSGSMRVAGEKRPLRYALEVRHASFVNPEFIDLLRTYGLALVVADTAGKWPLLEDPTSDFMYVRLHGDEKLYVSGYSPAALKQWGRKIRTWLKGGVPAGSRLAGKRPGKAPEGRDVFVYFDNDVKVRAPFDAMSLAHALRLGPAPAAPTKGAKTLGISRRGWPSVRRSRPSG